MLNAEVHAIFRKCGRERWMWREIFAVPQLSFVKTSGVSVHTLLFLKDADENEVELKEHGRGVKGGGVR